MTPARSRLKHLIPALMLVGATALLSGCGMTPVYGDRSLVSRLEQVEIEVPQTRLGYLLRQQLAGSLGDSDAAKAYDLKIEMDEKRYEIGLSNFGTATRFEISTKVDYVLTERATRKTIRKNSFVQTVTYDSTDSSYAAIAAQKDGQDRAATAIARTLQAELATVLSNAQP